MWPIAGFQPLDAKAAEEFYVRTWAEPSADVNGILGGKPGVRNTTLSVFASGGISPREAIEWVTSESYVESIVFGASSRANIENTVSLILQADKGRDVP